MKIYEKLCAIQNKLKAPKNQYNKFGGYSYRNCEDIFEAVKPLLKEIKTTLVVSDELVNIGNDTNQRFYIKATATLIDIEDGEKIENVAYAREEETKKGMDGSQITGAASSYARKYALNGLFLIDDVKDTDTPEYQTKEEPKLISDEQLTTLTNLDRPLKDKLVEHYKKDLTQFTELEAIQSIESLKKKGLLK